MDIKTVRGLREALSHYPDDFEIIYGTEELVPHRIKIRGDKLIQIEFNQVFQPVKNGKMTVIIDPLG